MNLQPNPNHRADCGLSFLKTGGMEMSLRFKICLIAWIAIVASAACTDSVSGQDLNFVQEAAVDAPLVPNATLPVQQSELTPLAAPITDASPEPKQTLINPVATPNAQADTEPLPQIVADDDWQIDIRPAAKVKVAPVVVTDEASNKLSFSAADYDRIYASIPFDRATYNANPSYRHDSTMEILTGNARHQTIVRHTTTTRSARSAQIVPAAVANPYPAYRYGYLRPALRLNYYKHFPSLNPYLNYQNLSGAY